KGLLWAGVSVAVMAVVILSLSIPENGLFRHPETGSLTVSPLMDSLVPLMMILFLVPSIIFGKVVKVINDSKDMANHLAKAMSGMGMYIVIAFVAAQMIAFFNWSNLGPIV
ncbi:AbgT family transporter, partial [Microvirga sp. 3-52]|nr:AbgT family transporter [Microvirga sp. 3-52]